MINEQARKTTAQRARDDVLAAAGFDLSAECAVCDGDGTIEDQKCSNCDGWGVIPVEGTPL